MEKHSPTTNQINYLINNNNKHHNSYKYKIITNKQMETTLINKNHKQNKLINNNNKHHKNKKNTK